MKKSVLFLCFIFVFLFLISGVFAELTGNGITGEFVTGESITGNVTSQQFSLSITVGVFLPSVNITYPENGTYFSSKNLPLLISASNYNFIWYNIDEVVNKSLTNSFNASNGFHTLNVYAQNGQGMIKKNVSFTVQENKFTIFYGDFHGEGSTTNFNESAYENLGNLEGVILEKENSGEIEFLEGVNLTNDLNNSDNLLDLDSFVNISQNRIFLNSTALPNLNVAARLKIYNLSFSNPRILKDGSVCEDCVKESYSGGTLTFNVTGFSVYSAEETPSSTNSENGGNGGGSSSSRDIGLKSLNKKDISFEEKRIEGVLLQGHALKKEFVLKNVGSSEGEINLSIRNLKSLASLEEENISLLPGESKKIILNFFANEDTYPDFYIGHLVLSLGKDSLEIPILLKIESNKNLFDASLKIPDKYKKVNSRGSVLSILSLVNFGEKKKVDAVIEYIIKDIEGKTVYSEKKTVAVETSASQRNEIVLPEEIKSGSYVLYARINYEGRIAIASQEFKVKRNYLWILLIPALVFLLVLFFLLRNISIIREKNKEGKIRLFFSRFLGKIKVGKRKKLHN